MADALKVRVQIMNPETEEVIGEADVQTIAEQVYFADSKSDSAPRSQAPASFPVPKPESFAEPTKGTGFSIGDFEAIEDDDSDLPF